MITSLKAGEAGDIYVLGEESYVTKFSRDYAVSGNIDSRGKYVLAAFEVYEQMELVVVVDVNGDLKLLDQSENKDNQLISLRHMRKDKGSFRLTRTGKSEFVVTKQSIANYQIVKKAIEMDYSLTLLEGASTSGPLLRLGMNDQLLDINLLTGLAQHNYSWDNTNNDVRLRSFVYSHKQARFVLLDDDNGIKEMYLKEEREESS